MRILRWKDLTFSLIFTSSSTSETGWIICPRSHGEEAMGPDLQPRSVLSMSSLLVLYPTVMTFHIAVLDASRDLISL